MTSKRQIMAGEYDRLAVCALALAESSSLEHVRAKHRRAAAAWSDLALLQRDRITPTSLQAHGPEGTPPQPKTLLMTSEEKLAAIQQGAPGSYNFWMPIYEDPEQARFQRLVGMAHDTARARGYFYRHVGDQATGTSGLLITISPSGDLHR